MITTSDFRNGLSLTMDGVLYQIVEYQHVKPGKGGAFIRTKLRNMRTKALIDRTFRSGEKFGDAFIDYKKLQYTYNNGGIYFFMDSATYEEISIPEDVIGERKMLLKEGMEVNSSWHNHGIVEITLPVFVDYKIEHTEPGVKGDTAKATFKPATLETGAVVQVPLFVNTGDAIKIDTRTGEYVERV